MTDDTKKVSPGNDEELRAALAEAAPAHGAEIERERKKKEAEEEKYGLHLKLVGSSAADTKNQAELNEHVNDSESEDDFFSTPESRHIAVSSVREPTQKDRIEIGLQHFARRARVAANDKPNGSNIFYYPSQGDFIAYKPSLIAMGLADVLKHDIKFDEARQPLIIDAKGRCTYVDPIVVDDILDEAIGYGLLPTGGASSSFIKDIREYLKKLKCMKLEKVPLGIICFDNGLFSFLTHEFITNPTKRYNFLSYIEHSYLPGAPTKEYDKFISAFTGGNEAIIRVIEALIAAVVMQIPLQTILLLTGASAGNGKSVLLDFFVAIAGIEKVAQTTPDGLEKNYRFEMLKFKEKSLAFMNDVERKPANFPWSNLKSLTGGDIIEAEYKGLNHRKKFKFERLFIITSNEGIGGQFDAGMSRRTLNINSRYIPSRKKTKNKDKFKERLHKDIPGVIARALKNHPTSSHVHDVLHPDNLPVVLKVRNKDMEYTSSPVLEWAELYIQQGDLSNKQKRVAFGVKRVIDQRGSQEVFQQKEPARDSERERRRLSASGYDSKNDVDWDLYPHFLTWLQGHGGKNSTFNAPKFSRELEKSLEKMGIRYETNRYDNRKHYVGLNFVPAGLTQDDTI